jgi:hypothetical protein
VAAYLVVAPLMTIMAVNAADANIECPPSHDGMALKDVELFDGPPANKIEIMPGDGRFVVPYTPRSLWHRFPQSTLGCTYFGSKDMVTVVLPRHIRVCEFKGYPRVDCH